MIERKGSDKYMNAIEVSHLTFSYDGQKDVIKDVSFKIPEGSYTTIVGQNGSGKTSISKIVANKIGYKYLDKPIEKFLNIK